MCAGQQSLAKRGATSELEPMVLWKRVHQRNCDGPEVASRPFVSSLVETNLAAAVG